MQTLRTAKSATIKIHGNIVCGNMKQIMQVYGDQMAAMCKPFRLVSGCYCCP